MSENPAISDPTAAHTFQVDLRGIVDLLSHHLYSSPRVYVRELLQNAIDAITARRVLDPDTPASIRLSATGDRMHITDTGIGLTEDEVHRFLATIGRSSKRAEDAAGPDTAEKILSGTRSDFLGQFGIGLLACFVVADEITVVTRSAKTAADGSAARAVEWRGASDGSYVIRILADGDGDSDSDGVRDGAGAHAGAVRARVEVGTTVTLTPRAGSEAWFQAPRVVELARAYGSLLPYEAVLHDEAGFTYRITDTPAVWNRAYASPEVRREALAAYCADALGFDPLDVIDLDIPLAGVRGAAFILPAAAGPALQGSHRVHLKGMLLSDSAKGLLPDWAFFVRCVIDTDSLRPTASRESLYEDEMLLGVRDALGKTIRDWLAGLAERDPARLNRFLAVHFLGVKALARFDDELFALMLPWLPFETTDGHISLQEFASRHRAIHLTASTEEFRQVAPIAGAAGMGVVNGGYTYDAELVRKLPRVLPGVSVTDLDADTVAAHLDAVDSADELAAGPFLAVARRVLEVLDCDVVLRTYLPLTVPALLLDGREARHERARADAASAAEGVADDLWAGILGALRSGAPRARLVLNHRSPLVCGMIAVEDRALAAIAVEALYGQALLLSSRPVRAAESALLNRAFLGLLEHAVGRVETVSVIEPATETGTEPESESMNESMTETED